MSSTPRDDDATSRFAAQNATAEDLLKEQTLGLVQLSDFRKRRAEAYTGRENDISDLQSGSASPASAAEAGALPLKKKVKTTNKKARTLIQLGNDDEEDFSSPVITPKVTSKAKPIPSDDTSDQQDNLDDTRTTAPRKFAPKAGTTFVPKITTKAAAQRESETRKQLATEYTQTQSRVKATEIIIPFVFFDGTNIPGGKCRVKKSDQIWLVLDKARKVGAELGVGGAKAKQGWARISVDDLMLVKDEVIIPHHYEVYHFVVNQTKGWKDRLFKYADSPTAATPESVDEEGTTGKNYNPLTTAGERKAAVVPPLHADSVLEGFHDDATSAKVVDRRWYERNKHIFPMSMWEEFDPAKDYQTAIRKDAQGNAFFY